MALRSLICATRFKYYDRKGALLPVTCPFCQEVDSFGHLLKCVMIQSIPREEEGLVTFLKQLARILEPVNKALPQPIHPLMADEVTLGWLGSSDEELSLSLT